MAEAQKGIEENPQSRWTARFQTPWDPMVQGDP